MDFLKTYEIWSTDPFFNEDTKEVLNLASSAHQEEEMTTPDGVVFSWLY